MFYEVDGWNASMHTNSTEVTLAKVEALVEGIDTKTYLTLKLEGYYPDWSEDLQQLLFNKLHAVGLINNLEQIKQSFI